MGWRVVWSQWPVACVWLVLVLPYLAFSTPRLTAPDSLLQPLPWWLRALCWALRHVWPYSRIVRMSAIWDEFLDRVIATPQCPQCGVRYAYLLGHLLLHFPGEWTAWVDGEALWSRRQQVLRDDWFTPPQDMTPEQAERWMEERARHRTGERPWAWTNGGSTSESRPA